MAVDLKGKLKTGVINLDKFNPSSQLDYEISKAPSIQFFAYKKTAPVEYDGKLESADIIETAEYLVTRMENEKNSEKVLHRGQSYYLNLL